MPLIVKDKKYPLPGEGSEKAATGRELVEIESHFDLDGLMLLMSMSQEKPPKGYTKAKAMYAMVWIVLTRAGVVVSIADVLNDYAIDDFDFEEYEEDVKKAQAEDSETAE